MSKISPKLQKLLVGGTILNNLDRLVDVLEGVKARQNPQAKRPFGIDGSCGFDQSLKMREVQKPQIFFSAKTELDDVLIFNKKIQHSSALLL